MVAYLGDVLACRVDTMITLLRVTIIMSRRKCKLDPLKNGCSQRGVNLNLRGANASSTDELSLARGEWAVQVKWGEREGTTKAILKTLPRGGWGFCLDCVRGVAGMIV